MAKVINKKTGAVETVADPSEGLLSGEYSLPKGAPVRVKDASGQVLEFDPAENVDFLRDLAAGKADGYSWASDREAELQAAEDEGLAAFGQGVARAATFGVSDAIQSELADDPIAERERLQTQREANPIASTAGEIAFDVGSALATGGASAIAKGAAREGGESLLRRGARALGSTPSALTTRVAEGAGELVARSVAKTGLGRGAQTVARLGAEGAIEGSAFALRDAQIDAYLSGEDLTGEQALAAIGHGALYGGAGGAGLGILGVGAKAAGKGAVRAGAKAVDATKGAFKLVPKPVRESIQDLARPVQEAFEGAPKAATGLDDVLDPSIADDAARAIDKAAEAESVAMQAAPQVRQNFGEEAEELYTTFARSPERRRAIEETAEVYDELSAEAKGALTDFERASRRSQEGFARGGKREIWARAMPDEVQPEAFTGAGDFFRKMNDIGETFIFDNAKTWKDSTTGKRIAALSEAFENDYARIVDDAIDGGNTRELATDLYLSLDAMKRELGAATQNAFKTPGKRAEAETLEEFYDELKGYLENPELFGSAAQVQTAVNEVWKRKIAASKARNVRGAFEDSGVQEGFEQLQRFSEGKARELVQLKNADQVDDLIRYTDESIATARAMADAGFDGAQKELDTLLKSRQRLDKVLEDAGFVQDSLRKQERLDQIIKRVDLGSRINPAQEAVQGLVERGASSGIGALIGSVAGPVGTIVGATAAPVLSSAIRRGFKESTDQLIDPFSKMLQDFARAKEGISPQTKSFLARAGDRLAPAVVKAKVAIDRTRTALNRAAENIAGVARRGRPAAVKAAAAVSVASFRDDAQRVVDGPASAQEIFGTGTYAQAVGSSFERGRQYLREQLPPSAAPSPYEPGRVRDVGRAEARAWLQKRDAVEDPLSVIEAIGRGEHPVHGIAALRSVYPSLYAQLRDKSLENARALAAKGKLAPAAKRHIEQLFPELRTSSGTSPAPPPLGEPISQPAPAPNKPVNIELPTPQQPYEAASQRVAGRPS